MAQTSDNLPFDLPANANLCRFLKPRHTRAEIPPLAVPDQVENWHLKLGTHPDLIARLWHELPSRLPVDCRRILYAAPVLIHPATGIVFGFASGTHTYALRLPAAEHAEALLAGAARIAHYSGGQPSFDLDGIGPEWVFGKWLPGEEAWCLAAFTFASAG